MELPKKYMERRLRLRIPSTRYPHIPYIKNSSPFSDSSVLWLSIIDRQKYRIHTKSDQENGYGNLLNRLADKVAVFIDARVLPD